MRNITTLHVILGLLLLTLVAIIGGIVFIIAITSSGMPSLYELENPQQKYATRIISADGEVLDHFFKEKRVPLAYNEIPKDFIDALVTTEDRKFWKHWGVHTGRVFKSLIKNIISSRTEGASTITMQLAGNLYLDRKELTLTRKVREAMTAFQIEQTYTKQEILELYVNTVNFGRGSYGLRIAAHQYFDKEPLELSTAECAFLVGLLKKPGYYNRKENYNDAIERRNLILNMMLEHGNITSQQFVSSISEEISFMQSSLTSDKDIAERRLKNMGIAPHFVETIRLNLRNHDQLNDIDFYTDGLTIYSTLDSRIQNAINKVVNEYMPDIQKTFNSNYSWSRNQTLLNKLIDKEIQKTTEYKNANEGGRQLLKSKYSKDKKFVENVKNLATTIQLGIVVIDQSNGAVVGMIGASPKAMAENSDAKYSLNHSVQIKRQPGSAFKPFVYASALIKGKTPDSQIESGPYSYTLSSGKVWSPHGYSKDSISSMTLTQALIGSVNTVSARLITQVTTPSDVVTLAQRAGVSSHLEAVPALSLGAGGDVSPLELAAAYSIFGNNGIFVSPYCYDRIEDKHGELIFERKPFSSYSDVLEREVSGQMTYMMQQVVNYGTATRVRNYLKNVDAAGKTGTTNDAADAWFIGYTPQLICGIWMGFDDKRVNFECLGAVGYGGRIAAPLWGAIMAEIYGIPSIPYKQQRFSSVKLNTDTTDVTMPWRPYSLTNTQKQIIKQQEENNTTPASEEEENIRKKTYIDAALLENKLKTQDRM